MDSRCSALQYSSRVARYLLGPRANAALGVWAERQVDAMAEAAAARFRHAQPAVTNSGSEAFTMTANIAEDLYALVLQLPVGERLRLVEKIAHDLSAPPTPAHAPADAASSGTTPSPERPRLTTLPRDVWDTGLGVIALGGDALADSEAYYDAP
jgi:hypothetical protein